MSTIASNAPQTLAGLEEVDRILDSAIFLALDGWCTPEKAKRMARLVAQAGADRYILAVELGVFGGRGTIAMGLAVKHCLAGIGAVHGIDPFTKQAALEGTNAIQNAEWWGKLDYEAVKIKAARAIRDFGVDKYTRLVIEKSLDVVGTYPDGCVDVLHQDSNHSEEVSCAEVEAWAPKVSRRGFWVFDDIDWPTTKKAQGMLVERKFNLIEMHKTWAVFQRSEHLARATSASKSLS